METPRPARPRLTAAQRVEQQEKRLRQQQKQLDLMRTRALADDAKMLTGLDKKTASLYAREANALAVLAGRLSADEFIRIRSAIGDDIAALQKDDPATKEAVDALEESGTAVAEARA